MSKIKTPPWERTSRDPRTDLDTCVLCASNYGYEDVAKRAWDELCALQAVAEAAEDNTGHPCEWHHRKQLVALKEWRALCPR